MKEDSTKAIEKIIAVCEESIEETRLAESLDYPRVPIDRSSTFMIRNTLRSILDYEALEVLEV